MADRAHDKKHVRLPGRKTRKPRPKTVHIIMRTGRGHVLHPATGRDKRILKDRKFTRPSDRIIDRGRHKIKFFDRDFSCGYFSHSKAPFFQAYT